MLNLIKCNAIKHGSACLQHSIHILGFGIKNNCSCAENFDQPPRRRQQRPFKWPQYIEEFNLYRLFPPNVLTSYTIELCFGKQNKKRRKNARLRTQNSTRQTEWDWPPLKNCAVYPFVVRMPFNLLLIVALQTKNIDEFMDAAHG